MLTFEAFFEKKKIDLVALSNVNPALYAEFKLHYEQMGEKSFDHTKKFWFNRLRKDFQLKTQLTNPVPVVQNAIAEQAKQLSSTTVEQISHTIDAVPPISFKPRLAKPHKEHTPDSSIETTEQNSPEIKKPAFKPGFMKTKDNKPTEETVSAESQQVADSTKKPVFKPRALAKLSTPTPKDENNDSNSERLSENSPQLQTAQPIKPLGFKPRSLVSKATTTIPKEQQELQDSLSAGAETPENQAGEKTGSPNSIGFKPRLLKSKSSIVDKQTATESINPPTPVIESPIKDDKTIEKSAFRPRLLEKKVSENEAPSVEKIKKNPAFKPKFGVKTGAKKSDESSDSPL